MMVRKWWLADPWNRNQDYIKFLFHYATSFEINLLTGKYKNKDYYEPYICFRSYWEPES